MEKNNLIDQNTNKKIPEETIRLLKLEDIVVKQLIQFLNYIMQKVIYHLKFLKELLIICGECVKAMNCGAKKLIKSNYYN